MNKVICDICGTAYPETAAQCPICGSAKPEQAAPAAESIPGEESGSYTYVKGGRFSKANVRKRNKAVMAHNSDPDEAGDEYPPYSYAPSNTGLVITAVLLVIAILAVSAYIFFNFFYNGGNEPQLPVQTTVSTTAPTTEPEVTTQPTTQPTTAPDLSCKALSVVESVTLDETNTQYLINAIPEPADTTDTFTYTSSAPEVASVSADGVITGVSGGEAEITVTCGEISATIAVSCDLPPAGPDPNADYGVFIDGKDADTRKYKNEVTLNRGNTFKLTLVNRDTDEVMDIQWVSGDEDVCSVDGNTVSYVGRGKTKVTVTIGDKTYECIISCT